jgi:hypothetical protein
MKLEIAVIAAASALSFNVHALTTTDTNWLEHGTLEEALGQKRTGLFEDTYRFHLTNPKNLFNTTVSANDGIERNIRDGHVFLWQEAGTVDIARGFLDFDGTTGGASRSFGELAAGDYYYVVKGDANGLTSEEDRDGGSYSMISSLKGVTAPVPEPQTYALLLAGLGVIGFVARRRRPQA